MSLPTADELLVELGDQLRSERVRQRLGQGQLAAAAGIARSALSRLENGSGGTLYSFVAVLRALGKTDWLKTLAPTVSISPMELLRSQKPPTKRVRLRKDERGRTN